MDVFLDGKLSDGVYLEGSSEWTEAALEILGSGEYGVVFEF